MGYGAAKYRQQAKTKPIREVSRLTLGRDFEAIAPPSAALSSKKRHYCQESADAIEHPTFFGFIFRYYD